jgi:SAM-dependent methyltransferase
MRESISAVVSQSADANAVPDVRINPTASEPAPAESDPNPTDRKSTDNLETRYRQKRLSHWEEVARQSETPVGWSGYYHKRLGQLYRSLVVPGLSVLELGCGHGDLLAALKPSIGVGIDFSEEMVEAASNRHKNLRFICADAHTLDLPEKFDVIILSDLLNDLWDVQTVFRRLRFLIKPNGRVILNVYSHLWEPILKSVEALGLAQSKLDQNWLTVADIDGLLRLEDWEIIKHSQEILWPLATWPLTQICNRYLVKLWPFRHLALTNIIVARPVRSSTDPQRLSVSVIVPARNEAGNIGEIFERVPRIGATTELVFVEGHSSDDTYGAIEKAIAAHPEWSCQLFRQTGKGKGDAVRLGFARAHGDVLMILDADLTVAPEDLPRFFDALASCKGDLINGVRLVYPMEREAMRFFNLLGNKFFSLAFSWLLGQSIKDTLCGTKVLRKRDYEAIAANRPYFGDFDPFGDFDLIFGAVKLNLKVSDLPIRYRERTYGTTNIQRWRHGWLLLRMVCFAARRLKFV